MEYTEGRQRVSGYVMPNGHVIELTYTRDNLKRNYQVLETYEDYCELAIRYPGYKTEPNKCDYCVCLVDAKGEYPISHVDIMKDLFDKTTPQNYLYMKQYIENVAAWGQDVNIHFSLTSTFDRGLSYEKLTDLMFYIAIQEDINYPAIYYQGRKMCFYRYLEAIYCKVHDNHRLEEAMRRAEAHNYIPKNWDDVGDLYDVVARIQR